MERRRAARFLLRCPAIFSWNDEQGRPQVGAGFTRDVSTVGVFVLSAAAPPAESRLQMQVLLPPPQPAEEGLKLQSEATVMRIESQAEGSGFAAMSEFALVADAVGQPQSADKPLSRTLGSSSGKSHPAQLRVGSGGH